MRMVRSAHLFDVMKSSRPRMLIIGTQSAIYSFDDIAGTSCTRPFLPSVRRFEFDEVEADESSNDHPGVYPTIVQYGANGFFRHTVPRGRAFYSCHHKFCLQGPTLSATHSWKPPLHRWQSGRAGFEDTDAIRKSLPTVDTRRLKGVSTSAHGQAERSNRSARRVAGPGFW